MRATVEFYDEGTALLVLTSICGASILVAGCVALLLSKN